MKTTIREHNHQLQQKRKRKRERDDTESDEERDVLGEKGRDAGVPLRTCRGCVGDGREERKREKKRMKQEGDTDDRLLQPRIIRG